MGFLDTVAKLLVPHPLQERQLDSFTDHPGLTEQLLAVQGLSPRPWKVASIKEALGVPAILRAVTLISNTTGQLAMDGIRNGERLDPPPRIVQRPNPFSTPRDFFRDTAYSLATRGEFLWWIAARDSDGTALSLIPINPAEMKVDENPRDRRYPIYTWGSREMPRDSIVHGTYLREPGSLRGVGPLQLCGAAISVMVEAQEWAANFFGGGTPSILLKSQVALSEQEAKDLKSQWMEETRAGVPRVSDPTLEVDQFGIEPERAQLTSSRDYSNGDAARMFGVPGSLMEFSTPGSSLTYQNVEGEYTKFARTCLVPNYLEPIEQAMSDLMSRSTVGRFNLEGLLRADIKTRYEVYTSGIASGMLNVEEARRMEGLDPGGVEVTPIPPAVPAADPGPIQFRSDSEMLEIQKRSEEREERLLAVMERPQPTPIVNNYVETPVTIAEGAIQIKPAEVNVTPPANQIDVAAADMTPVAEAIANLANRPQEPPSVTITAPDITVEPAQVTVNLPEQTASTVTVSLPEPKKIKRTVLRDAQGVITGIEEQ